MFVGGPILQGPLPFKLPPLVRTTPASQAADIVEELVRDGVDFAGHLPPSVSLSEAILAGQRSIEHLGSASFRGVLIACSSAEADLLKYAAMVLAEARDGRSAPDQKLFTAAFMERIADTYDLGKAKTVFALAAKHGSWQVPTLSALRHVWTEKRGELTGPDVVALDRLTRQTITTFGEMRAAGVRVLAGTDRPMTGDVSPLHDELVALVDAGMAPMTVLQAATRDAAEFVGRADDLGTIAVGKRTALVLLRANPLQDIRNTRGVVATVIGGRLVEP